MRPGPGGTLADLPRDRTLGLWLGHPPAASQTAGAPFSGSSSLVPSSVKAYYAHFFKEEMLIGLR